MEVFAITRARIMTAPLSSLRSAATKTPIVRRLALLLCLTAIPCFADGAIDNRLDGVRRQPPLGSPISEADRQELQSGVDTLGKEIRSLETELQKKPSLLALLPDVQIFHKAVAWALQYDEIFNPTNEVPAAREQLRQGLERARALREGRSPWTLATGLVVRGYRSRLDDSVQPYGLVVPPSFQTPSATRHRLDFWFHGRGETLSELNFLRDRSRSPGEFRPRDTFVLHPYSRYCNGQKLAGEVDAFEALEHVQRNYPIDNNRIVVRGFSLGGAACWHLAVHHASRWVAAAPGAGFSETPDFLKVFQRETLQPTWYEKKLWHLYDCPDYAINLTHCPTVVYSGEKDSQKQAADIMEKALLKEGMNMTHIIGAGAGHNYTPAARAEINARIDSIAARGREIVPPRVRFATWTLKYNQMAWVVVDGLETHWEEARIDATLQGNTGVTVSTRNVSAFSLEMPAGHCPLDGTAAPAVTVDGTVLRAARPGTDRSWTARFEKRDAAWKVRAQEAAASDGLRKKHNLQGPIDDAFLNSFLVVKPSGQGWHPATHAWALSERERAVENWRRHFRGDARVKSDSEVNEQDIQSHNLILWGDPASNPLIARILSSLPLGWTKEALTLGGARFDADKAMPVLVFPNPLNPSRYVVLNSGFTFREYDYLNNARQVPKLPDYAIINITKPATSRFPGEVSDAGFFTETWTLPKH